MASTAVLPAMNGTKTLHPFFTKGHGQNDANETPSSEGAEREDVTDETYDDTTQDRRNAKKRKPKTSLPADGKTQKTLQEIVNPRAATVQDDREIPNSCSSEPLLSSPKHKRRRTSPPVEETDTELAIANEERHDEPRTPQRPASPQVIIPVSSPLPAEHPPPVTDVPSSPPKKMLRLNASGKFSSPPSKKPKEEAQSQAPRRRGRPRKSKDADTKTKLIVMSYGVDSVVGERISRILNGEERVEMEIRTTPKKSRMPRKPAPSKPTHPFFLGKPKESVSKPESPKKATAVTPGKLRRQTLSFGNGSVPEPSDTWTSSLLKDRLIMRQPGAMEPVWPRREQTHVRGLDGADGQNTSFAHAPLKRRKQKSAKRPMPDAESLLSQICLHSEAEGGIREDGFRDPHPSLNLPERLLISGEEILQHSSEQFYTRLPDRNLDELSLPTPPQQHHPAVLSMCERVRNTLTPYDEGRGEINGWAHKYAPSTASEVLQPAREMDVLKQWLTSLTVTAVIGNTSRPESKQGSKPEPKPKKKRRKKNKDMDDFLVDSDEEEVRDMDELTDPADEPLLSSGRKGIKSVVQTIGDGVKLSNAVLLTGPHGCGKTAAAFAVAKELGFKVFEISPCERRSGKDVLDKVGDMTENHLVKHHGVDPGEVSASEERNDEAFNRDLASGRQGKMSAFFRPQANKEKSSPKKQAPKPQVKAIEQIHRALKKPAKDQQQSLILLEEVDILFKEDKDFWSTVLKLIFTSKRPFIMTCNDEDLVPLQAMTLHAILRLSPAPVDLVADYLIAMAAAEGHLIKRDAARSLYTSKGSDLRSTISDLQFWCQMGIGDPRGGLTWIYQRFPPGSDLDSQGRRVRVVSKGTFQPGMGITPDSRLSEEDQALWLTEAFETDPSTLLGWQTIPESAHASLPILKDYTSFAASLSAIDVFTTPPFTLDTSQPPMKDKSRTQYIEGLSLLQTDEMVNYDTLSSDLSITATLSTRRLAGFTQPIHLPQTHRQEPSLTRKDFTCLDALATPPAATLSLSNQGLTQSTLDGPLNPIVLDLAPYVRAILQHEAAVADQLEVIGEGRGNKRARTTRAARSALQGGRREAVRRERWFGGGLDEGGVLSTGGDGWPKAGLVVEEHEVESAEEYS